MKKISKARQKRILIAGQMRWENTLKRKPILYNPDKIFPERRILGGLLISAPKTISIYDTSGSQAHYENTIIFLNRLEKNIKEHRNCIIDFSETSDITAAALVLVYARIESSISCYNHKIGMIWSKCSNRVNRFLKSSNLYKLLQSRHITSYSLGSAKTIPIVSSVGNNQMEEVIDFIQKRVFNDQMSPTTEHIYADAVSETINNVGLHAYPGIPNSDKRWWLMCEAFEKKLYLAIYDQGVGIPKTVVDRPWFWATLSAVEPDLYNDLHKTLVAEFPELKGKSLSAYIPRKIPDEKLIYLSMQGDISGTKKDKHGQGSKSIMALVSDTRDGKLWVFSNNGVYNFSQEDQTPGMARLNQKFPGTLVQWNIELP